MSRRPKGDQPVSVRALRGATRLTADDPVEMTDAVIELVTAMLDRNGTRQADPHLDDLHLHPRPRLHVPGGRGARHRPRRRAADLRPGDRGARGAVAGRAGDGARRDRPCPGPRSSTSTCAAPRRCARTWPSDTEAAAPPTPAPAGPVLVDRHGPHRQRRSRSPSGRAGSRCGSRTPIPRRWRSRSSAARASPGPTRRIPPSSSWLFRPLSSSVGHCIAHSVYCPRDSE